MNALPSEKKRKLSFENENKNQKRKHRDSDSSDNDASDDDASDDHASNDNASQDNASDDSSSNDNGSDANPSDDNPSEQVTDTNESEASVDEQLLNRRHNTDHKKAFGGQTQTYKFNFYGTDQPTNVDNLFIEVRDELSSILKKAMSENETLKVTLDLEGFLEEYEYETFNFDATTELNSKEDIKTYLEFAQEKIQSKFQEYEFTNPEPKQLSFLYLHIHKIAAPDNIALSLPWKFKFHVTDFGDCPANDKVSFKWSVLAALHPNIKGIDELEEYSNELVMDGVKYPVQLSDLQRIEEMNTFSVNVYILQYSYEIAGEEVVGPVYHTNDRKASHVNLLLLHDNQNNRFCHIKDLKHLVCPGVSSSHFCDSCLNVFSDKASLKRHQRNDCLRVKTTLASEVQKFSNELNTKNVIFVVYADFEALLQVVGDDTELENAQKQTKNIRKHVPFSYGYYIKCVDDRYSVLKTYKGIDCTKKFAKNLIENLKRQFKKYNMNHMAMPLQIEYVPVFLHNLQRYDSHFIIGESECDYVLGNLNKYFAIHKSFLFDGNKIQLRILDSRKFLIDSLEVLTQNLTKNKEHFDFNEINKLCETDEDLLLLTRKGVFPYNYIKSLEDLEKTSLPYKEEFYDDLKDTEISDEEYDHALRVWDHFECNTIGEYSNLYLKTDVLLLAEVFENFRRFCKSNYELDPAHYYSISGFSYDAMLKYTKVKLELLTDVEMLSFIKKSIRGGYACCNKRHAIANNKYLPTYKENDEESYILYYDANNLYGHAMCQPLPYGGFEWVDSSSVNYKVPDGSKVGYILEVDFSYPSELHDIHADLPFCPEKKAVPGADKDLLVADLTTKRNYVIHHTYLALCVEHGLKIEKIHRVLKFKQKPWLKPYIDFNNSKRMNALTEYDKNMFKLLNNSIYGKTCQNIENYETIKLFNHWGNAGNRRGASNIIGRSDYIRHTICSENMVAIKLKTTNLKFKDPLYVGFCILDLAKAHMYKFHYNFMKKKFGDKLCLLYTDTDSFVYQIKTHDYYKKIKPHLKDWFDTSNYKSQNQFQIPQFNKMQVGYFKDEMAGSVVEEFIGLRPRMYAIHAEDKTIMRASGVPRKVTDKFKIKNYRNCLYTNEPTCIEYKRIIAISHDLYTQRVRKTGLSPKYSKRYILPNLVDTLPWGHYSIMDDESE